MIKVSNVRFIYENGIVAVDDISLEIQSGENIAIIGQNGAGKTTFVKMLNGLLRPQEGTITIDGEDTTKQTVARLSQKVGYVFQNPGDQIFNRTVYDEIAYTLRYQKKSATEVDEKVKDASTLCGIVDQLKLNPYDLPFSIRKFVTIASVIAMGSKYVILDEPTAGQDLHGLEQQKHLINQLLKRGKTVVTITHDMEFVARNFNRVVVMADKKIIADDNCHEIFWNFDILKKSAIKQPPVSVLAGLLKMEGKIVTNNEFIKLVHCKT